MLPYVLILFCHCQLATAAVAFSITASIIIFINSHIKKREKSFSLYLSFLAQVICRFVPSQFLNKGKLKFGTIPWNVIGKRRLMSLSEHLIPGFMAQGNLMQTGHLGLCEN